MWFCSAYGEDSFGDVKLHSLKLFKFDDLVLYVEEVL